VKQGMARGRGNAKKRVADMSLPAGERGRKRKGKGRGTKGIVAQMDHGNSPQANDLRRTFKRTVARVPERGQEP
jgi:hypothetical protein